MKKILTFFLALFLSIHAFSWGPTGHRVVGIIGEKNLNKKAKKELDRILAGQSMALASTWMDEVRVDTITYGNMSDWHWVTIPEGATYANSEKNPKGDILQTLERIITELKSKKLTAKEETIRIKILIHLVGDLHMPLHVGSRNDRGGNEARVKWFGSNSNLHRVWDSDMIDDTKLSYTELAESLDQPTETQIQNWQKNTIHEWAAESTAYHNTVYDYTDEKLGYEYSYKNFPIVRARLLQAGIRLAGILNEIYGV